MLLLAPAAPQDLLVLKICSSRASIISSCKVRQLKNRWKSCSNKRGDKGGAKEEEGDGDEGERARGFVRASGVKHRAGRQAGR